MTEIFTQPPAGGAAPGPSQPGGSTDKKLTILIGFSVVFLIAALGTLGWVVLAGGDDGKRVETAQRNEADSERDAATKSADEQSSNDEASGDDSEEAASEEADVTLPKTTVPPPDPVEVTPQVTNVSFERPAAPSIVCTGEPLAYSGAQLVDGDENYGWGASMGDAAGATADMRFVGPVKLATVGLTPGYTRLAAQQRRLSDGGGLPLQPIRPVGTVDLRRRQFGRAELRTAGGAADDAGGCHHHHGEAHHLVDDPPGQCRQRDRHLRGGLHRHPLSHSSHYDFNASGGPTPVRDDAGAP